MPKDDGYVFVLWGDNFEEVTASVFITELRAAGLRVKVVGLVPQRIRGSHGLALVPDLTLDQALVLAHKSRCVIIPYAAPGIKRLKNDPRLSEFFQQAHLNQAIFVLGKLSGTDMAALGLPPSFSEYTVAYPESEDLVAFARELAGSLQHIRTGPR
jgi:hypothetical protein